MSLRILIATDQWFPAVRGGVARLATESAEQLAARGHEVTACSPPATAGEHTGERLRVIPALRRGRIPQTFSDPIDTARAARSLGREFDVLLGHNSTTASGLLAAGLGVPLVTFFHASAVLELEFLRQRSGLSRERLAGYGLKAMLAARERRSLDGASRILILSEFTRGLLAQRNPDAAARATLVPGAVDTTVFAPGDREASRQRLGIEPDETVALHRTPPRPAHGPRRAHRRRRAARRSPAPAARDRRCRAARVPARGPSPRERPATPRRAARPDQRRGAGRLVPRGRSVRAAHPCLRGLRDGDDRGTRERNTRGRHARRSDPGVARPARRAAARGRHERRRPRRRDSRRPRPAHARAARAVPRARRSNGTPGRWRSRSGRPSSRPPRPVGHHPRAKVSQFAQRRRSTGTLRST